MPYASESQRRYFNYNRSALQKQGVDVDEWNKASAGKHLPEHVKGSPAAAKHQRFKRGMKKAFPNR